MVSGRYFTLVPPTEDFSYPVAVAIWKEFDTRFLRKEKPAPD